MTLEMKHLDRQMMDNTVKDARIPGIEPYRRWINDIRLGKCIIYWMQAAQRMADNPAFFAALEEANAHKLPLIVVFCVTDSVPDANLRHYRFMFQGLYELAKAFASKQLSLFISFGDPFECLVPILPLAKTLFLDTGYLNWQRELRTKLYTYCAAAGLSYLQYETEPIVPLEIASPKEEYAAATLRPKLLKVLEPYLYAPPELPEPIVKIPGELKAALSQAGFLDIAEAFSDSGNLETWIAKRLAPDPGPPARYCGGHSAAMEHLQQFVDMKLPRYGDSRNNPATSYQSELSPYLHFGQISAREIVRRIIRQYDLKASDIPAMIKQKSAYQGLPLSIASFCEELIVRRELSMNFCHYNPGYDSYSSLPGWARESLEIHSTDPRNYKYSIDILENAQTHDPYWNAAQRELLVTGKMHNYMRMYWGKKLIEWTPDPETAYYLMMYLNDKYELDGRDPNSFAGIAWCFGKHDRPWQSRPIFGSVRYMNSAGLERKFDMIRYVQRIEDLQEA